MRFNRLIAQWILASIAVPVLLGGGSWLAYEGGFGFLSEGLAGPFFFSMPMAPFIAVVYFGPKGQSLIVPVALALGGNVLLYVGLSRLHARWQGLARVDRWLRLVPSVFAILLAVLGASSIIAFSLK